MESIGIGVIVTAKKVREVLNSLQKKFVKEVEELEDKEIKKQNK
jgi:predicted DNA-binding transcriptional regulator